MRPLTEQEARQAIRLVREMSTTFKDFFLDDLKPEMNWVRDMVERADRFLEDAPSELSE
jgi:hypothetical protein